MEARSATPDAGFGLGLMLAVAMESFGFLMNQFIDTAIVLLVRLRTDRFRMVLMRAIDATFRRVVGVSENMRDAIAKGRFPVGQNSVHAKLTRDNAIEIYARYKNGEFVTL